MTTITTIKRKSDIEDLLNEMPKGSIISIPSIFGGYGEGFYDFKKVNDEKLEEFCSGQNWRDREISIRNREEVIDTIWENRKALNRRLRRLSEHGFSIIEYH